MAVIVVTSEAQGAGKTGVATAIARHFAYHGTPVRLARVASAAARSNADADAHMFAALDFVPGSGAAPVAWQDITDPGSGGLLVVEADAADLGPADGAKVVLVSRNGLNAPAGVTPAATVALRRRATPATATVPEDRVLNGFSLAEAQSLLHADVLVPPEVEDATCDYLVVAPIASDAGQPYFRRFDGTMGVVARFDKTDMHLAAMQSDPVGIILSGGRQPSGYTIDAATSRACPLLLSRTDTENTIIALERVYDRTRFQGARKLDRMCELLEATELFVNL